MKKVVLFIVILVAVFLSISFYWYEYRPSNIRKECYSKVMQILREKGVNNNPTNEEANNLFRRCLVKEGLNAEDLVK